MNARRAIDVRGLPTYAFGSRDAAWWAVVLLIAIESTMLALLVMSYFYIRQHYELWPPSGVGRPALLIATLEVVCLIASAVPNRLATKAAYRGDLRGTRVWLLVTTILGALFVALRGVLFSRIEFRWDSHAYGSVFWSALGLNLIHAASGVLENLFLLVLLYRGPVEKKLFVDVELSALLWNFVIGSWVPIYVIFYLEAVLFPK